ncbi:MAG: hypothetical protein N2235_01210 [Fischerella sp.]|nr:hypothetical protein [Fischerella sp.]
MGLWRDGENIICSPLHSYIYVFLHTCSGWSKYEKAAPIKQGMPTKQ